MIIIGTMVLNHYVGIINNDGAFVDQAVGIGVAGFMRVVFIEGAQAGFDSPTYWLFVLRACWRYNSKPSSI